MPARWTNHKSHFKQGHHNCELTKHLFRFHRGEDPQAFLKIKLLEIVQTEEEAKERELFWQRKLFSFYPSGLNRREEESR